jgi:hypothetical protein
MSARVQARRLGLAVRIAQIPPGPPTGLEPEPSEDASRLMRREIRSVETREHAEHLLRRVSPAIDDHVVARDRLRQHPAHSSLHPVSPQLESLSRYRDCPSCRLCHGFSDTVSLFRLC